MLHKIAANEKNKESKRRKEILFYKPVSTISNIPSVLVTLKENHPAIQKRFTKIYFEPSKSFGFVLENVRVCKMGDRDRPHVSFLKMGMSFFVRDLKSLKGSVKLF